MKISIIILFLALAFGAALNLGGCNYRNVEDIKANAAKTWDAAGFEIVGYEGYQIGDFPYAPGGKVWHVVQRKGDSRIRYSGYVTKWRDEYHIYSITAMDAIAPERK